MTQQHNEKRHLRKVKNKLLRGRLAIAGKATLFSLLIQFQLQKYRSLERIIPVRPNFIIPKSHFTENYAFLASNLLFGNNFRFFNKCKFGDTEALKASYCNISTSLTRCYKYKSVSLHRHAQKRANRAI